MSHKSMFAIYLYEDENGQVSVRADSYGDGVKVLGIGFEILDNLIRANEISGGNTLFMLPVDRCESVQ